MPSHGTHFEPYVHLVDVTPNAALISWGGFWFRRRDTDGDGDLDSVLVDDADLDQVAPQRRESIGARSTSFGHAVVEVHVEGRVVGRAEAGDVNHVWVDGLQPDTEYTYRITVDGEPWAEAPLLDWRPDEDGSGGALERRGRQYARRFRTPPPPDASAPLTFAVIGDFGFGVRTTQPDAEHQRQVARALERVVETRGVRLVLTTGDNIYLANEETPEETGDEDDDWFFAFYQPYRYVLDRVPVYPSVGNHDSSDEESSDDRAQLEDNFFIEERFGAEAGTERSSMDPGLFYSFRFGREVQLIAVDTSLATELDERRFFDHPEHVRFLEEAMPEGGGGVRWRIPFMHHPPFCAGPHHPNTTSLQDRLLPLAKRSGVRLVLSGHEHNFQHSVDDGIHFVITGAAGKLRPEPPTDFEASRTRGWAVEPHLLLVEIDGDEARVTPIGGCEEGAEPGPIDVRTPQGNPVDLPIVIRLDDR